MIEHKVGNIFKSNANCLVNAVNCEGVMGKGIAAQFKERFPLTYADYVKACKTGLMSIGSLRWFTENGVTVVNFPTKDKWRDSSKLEYIEKGLNALIIALPYLRELHVSKIAIPALGCGCGGLRWVDVSTLIESKLSPYDNWWFMLYEPDGY